jgi:ABC-type lipoprotein export system ATPase subunit
MDLLDRLRMEDQTTTVMVTHDAHLARRGDRSIEIVDGVIHRQMDLDEG